MSQSKPLVLFDACTLSDSSLRTCGARLYIEFALHTNTYGESVCARESDATLPSAGARCQHLPLSNMR